MTARTQTEMWAALEGHNLNGVFPLRRFLGSSSHSGVFLTEMNQRGTATEVALKLVPANSPLADVQLARWLIASGLEHPNVLRPLNAGRCRVEGRHFQYVLTEYADQTLAQLLERRAMTEEEAREMLPSVLQALAFVHGRKFVQGQLKPSNILAVGDQIKIACDTLKPIGEVRRGGGPTTVYDPPEARDGSCSAAGDIWALGVTLHAALTRRYPGLRSDGGVTSLSSDLPISFRELVIRCLSRDPTQRPGVADIEAWLRDQSDGAAARAAAASAASTAPITIATDSGSPAASSSSGNVAAAATAEPPFAGRAIALIIGSMLVFALGWGVVRGNRSPAVPSTTVVEPARSPAPRAAAISPPASTSTAPTLVPAKFQESAAPAVQAEAAAPGARGRIERAQPEVESSGSGPGVYEEIPEVPQKARQTIRGTIKVAVRVIVEQDGTVFAALADEPGPSPYFERLAVDAAKKWTFPPSETPEPRFMQVRFDFTRDGTTARAVPVP